MAEVNSHGILVPKCEQYFPLSCEDSGLTFTKTADPKTTSITVELVKELESDKHGNYEYRKLQIRFEVSINFYYYKDLLFMIISLYISIIA